MRIEEMARMIRKFMRLPGREKILLAEAVLFDLTTGLVLRVFPFRMIPRLYASRRPSVRSCHTEAGNQQLKDIVLIRTAVQRAGSVSPWRNRCLVSSLSARWMLSRRRIGSELFLGMAKDNIGKMAAHAWLKSGETEVVPMNGDYIPLYTF